MFRIPLLLLLLAGASLAGADLDSAEYWFKNRALHSKNDHADSLIVEKSIFFYKRALTDSLSEERAAEGLLYMFHFKGCYATENHEARLALFAEAKELGERMHAKYPKNKKIASYYAQNLSLWAREYGAYQAVKEGVAKKVRDISTKAENWQFLGRAHQLLPYIPILLNWPDKKLADKYLSLSHGQHPEEINTSLFLAELRFDQKRYGEALELVNEALGRGVRETFVVEDKRTRWKLKDLRGKIQKKLK